MTCQNAADESGTGLRYALLCQSTIMPVEISQASDGKLAPANMSTPALRPFDIRNKATLDKMRQKHKTRLGRFITSPWRLAVLRLLRDNITSHASFFGDRPRVAWGQAPKSMLKTLRYFNIPRSYRLNSKNENSMRNILKLTLLRLKRYDFLA